MWWKIYFWFDILLLSLTLLTFLSPKGINIPILIFMILTYCLALVGLYKYVFRKDLISKRIWKYYFWIYALIDLISFATGFVPLSYQKYISFLLLSNHTSLQENSIDTFLDIPMLYALYQLSRDKLYEPKPKKKKKNTRFQWGMVQMALWGYSSVLTFFFLVLAFFPQGGVVDAKQSINPFFLMMVSPFLLFWLWVLLRFKEYKWNWLRTTLIANAILYSGSMVFGMFFPQPQSGTAGFDIISVLQLFILLVSYYYFGKEQFGYADKKALHK